MELKRHLFFSQAFEELERLFSKSGICVAVKEKLTKDSGVAGAFDYNHIVAKLLAKPKARGKNILYCCIDSWFLSALWLFYKNESKIFLINIYLLLIIALFMFRQIYHFSTLGVIVFGSDQEVAELMKAVKRLNATGHFNWIGSDGWSARALVSDGNFLYHSSPPSIFSGKISCCWGIEPNRRKFAEKH